jgi:glycosyltransferase involved in cell wall biosynthesis
MKIAIVGPSPVPFVVGGVEKFLWGLCDAINTYTPHQCELIKVPSDESTFGRTLRSYWRFFRLDLSHFDMVLVTKYPAWMVRHPMKVCYMQHRLRGVYDTYAGPTGPFAFLKTPPWRMAGPWMRAVLHRLDDWALSPSQVADFYCISFTVACRPGYFPLGVLLDAIPHPPSPDRFEEGDFRHVFTVSRLDRPKRVELLVQAMQSVRAPVDLVIAGTGPEEERLRQLAAGDPRIRFTGALTDGEIRRLYADALLVAYAPDKEDYGLVTIEAMKSGKPVLTCLDSGGPNEFVTDGETGFSVPPDPVRLAEKIDRLAADPDLARRMGQAARQRVAEIDWKDCIAKMHRSFYFHVERGRAAGRTAEACLAPAGVDRKLVLVLSTYRIHPPRQGGQSRIFHLYRELARHYDVIVLSFTDFGEPFEQEALAPGFWEVRVPLAPHHVRQIVDIEARAGESVRDVTMPLYVHLTPKYAGIVRMYARQASAVVLSHPYLESVVPRLGPGTLLVYEAHNVEAELKRYLATNRTGRKLLRLVRRTERRAARRSDLVLATSAEDAATLARLYGLAPERVGVVPNGVDCAAAGSLPRDEASLASARRSLGWDERRPVCVFVGSWHHPNLEAVRAIADLAPRFPEVGFEVLGDVRRLFELKDSPERLPPNVRLHGPVSEETKHAVFAAATLALNPMRSGGGTNLKMLDYLAWGLPTLSTEIGARGLGLADGPHGRIGPLDRWPALLRELLADEPQRVALARAGRELCQGRFDWQRLGQEAFELLERPSAATLPAAVDFDAGRELGYGWHGAERWLLAPGRRSTFAARWTRGPAVVTMPNPKRPARLVLETFCGPKVRQLDVRLGDDLLASLSLDEGWQTHKLSVPRRLGQDRLTLRLDSETWVPDEVHGNGDLRRLGVALRRLELCEDRP